MTEQLIKAFVDNAERLGGFSSAAVWAFFCLVFLVYIFMDLRSKAKSSNRAWDARLEEAKADILLANSLEHLSKEVDELRQKVQPDTNGEPHA